METSVLETRYIESAVKLQRAINLLRVASHLLKGFIKWHDITNAYMLEIVSGIDELVASGVFEKVENGHTN